LNGKRLIPPRIHNRRVEWYITHWPDGEKEPHSAKEILQEYWKWIGTFENTTGKLNKAVTYAQNQKQYLETFLRHGDIEISNIQVEIAIRPFVVGRMGWLFSDPTQRA
jgi:hypothetical protein